MRPFPPYEAIRRHSDGSLDLDHYRMRAAALRRQAMQDVAATLTSAGGGIRGMIRALARALFAATAPRFVPDDVKLTDSSERDIERRLLFGSDRLR